MPQYGRKSKLQKNNFIDPTYSINKKLSSFQKVWKILLLKELVNRTDTYLCTYK